MKHRNTLTLILLLAALTLAAQSNYSPCYTNNMSKGNTAFSQGKYSEARTYYANAKQCAGGNPTAAQQKISACDAKIKAQREAADAKRKAEQEAAVERQRMEEEAKRKAEQEAAEAKRKEEEAKRKAEIEAAEAKRKVETQALAKTYTVNGVSFTMKYVEGGSFYMGKAIGEDLIISYNAKPSHKVTIRDFCIGETEVTQALWKAVMGYNPSRVKGDNLPVSDVSWDDCQKFIQKLNTLTGKTFRLPTEAEWEYSARGGNKRRGYKYAGSNSIGAVAWYDNEEPKPVKKKSPNELGLYDMSGNVEEWCWDWYDEDYYSNSPQTDPQGPSSGTSRVYRGGSFISGAGLCYLSCRNHSQPNWSHRFLGFRLVLIP